MVPVPFAVEPIMKNNSYISLIRLVDLKAYIISRTMAAFISARIELITFYEAVFCANRIRVSVWDPFCSRRGKENQLMSEVRTVERNMLPHREFLWRWILNSLWHRWRGYVLLQLSNFRGNVGNYIPSNQVNITLEGMPKDLVDGKLAMVRLLDCCHWTTSHKPVNLANVCQNLCRNVTSLGNNKVIRDIC